MRHTPRLLAQIVHSALPVGSSVLVAGFLLAPWAMWSCGSSTSDATGSTVSTTATSKSCDQSEQPSCPSVVPSYSSTIKGIISTYCLECHNPGGVGATASTTGGGAAGGGAHAGNPNNPNFPNAGNPNGGFNDQEANWDPNTARDWSDYNKIVMQRQNIIDQVFLCDMPPSGATALDAADRATLLQWLACRAPNN